MSAAEQFVSPRGELMWLFVDGAGKKQMQNDGEDKPNKFEASIRYHNESPELKEITDQINAYWEENKPRGKKRKSNAIREEYEKGTENKTGFSLVTFKSTMTFKGGDKKTIMIYDCANPPNIVNLGKKKIGNGSIGYLSGAMDIYDMKTGAGVTLYLNAVQIFKPEWYEGSAKLAEVEEEGGWNGSSLNNEAGFVGQAAETAEIDKPPEKVKL